MPKRMDLTGQKFNMLTVLKFYDVQNGMSRWLCKCDCGNEVIVYGRNLKSGNTMSCGCYHKKHNNEFGYKHGWSKTRLYNIWCDMKSRCSNPNEKAYKWYGGKGISVCKEWESDFTNFKNWALNNGYDDTLTIDRVDSNDNYYPENCRWIPYQDNVRRAKRMYSGIAINTKTNEEYRFSAIAEFARQHNLNIHSAEQAAKKRGIFGDWKFILDTK